MIIIQVKCRQTTVEISIGFNHVSEPSLSESRLDGEEIFPNVLIRSQQFANLM